MQLAGACESRAQKILDGRKSLANEAVNHHQKAADLEPQIETAKRRITALRACIKEQPKRARQLGYPERLHEEREQLKKLTAERTESAQRAFEDVLMAKVAEGIEADIPEEMVELQAERMMEQFKQQLASQGIPFDQYLKMTNTAEADFRKQAQGPAADQVKMDLAVEAIIKAEGLEASDEDVESEMKSVAEKYGMDLDAVKKYLRPEDVKEQVIREKVVKLVADSAVAVAPAEEKAELEVVEKKAAKKAPAKKPAKKDAEKDAE